MRSWTKFIIFLLFLLLGLPLRAQQQITGVVIDEDTGEAIPMASLVYKGHGVAKAADMDGKFSISRHEGWNLTVSSVGYKERIIRINGKTKLSLKILLKSDKQQLEEVTVKSKRHRYSRKENPAVELMRKVVAAKKLTDLKMHDFYQYNLYEKLTLALNDLTPEEMERKLFNRIPLIRRLKCREFFAVNMLWAGLSDKNNPYLEQNRGNDRRMYFPDGANIMDPNRPYAELVLGMHNIFKLFHVEYVRRLVYNELPTSPKWGMRYVIDISF